MKNFAINVPVTLPTALHPTLLAMTFGPLLMAEMWPRSRARL